MRLVHLQDLTSEQFNALAADGELSEDEKAAAVRLYLEQVSAADRPDPADWDKAESFEEFVLELQAQQQQWDEQRR